MDDKMSNLEIANQNIESLKYYYNILNKGIDELLKKYEEEANSYTDNQLYSDTSGKEVHSEQYYQREIFKEIIQDLKALKGE